MALLVGFQPEANQSVGMLIQTIGTSIELTAAVTRSGRLFPGGQFAQVTLAGEFYRPRILPSEEHSEVEVLSGDPNALREVFYLSCVASGTLAGRVGTLAQGEAVLIDGSIGCWEDETVVIIQSMVRLRHDALRLELDAGGHARLLYARNRLRVRGMLVKPPQLSRLEEGTAVCNARLGLTVKQTGPAREAARQGIVLEVAAYRDQGELLAAHHQGQYLDLTGVLQRRRAGDGTRTRIEALLLETLHDTRAMV